MQVRIEEKRTVTKVVWGCDGCKKAINPKLGDEIVQVFVRKMDKKANGRKIWKTLKQESYHKGCYRPYDYGIGSSEETVQTKPISSKTKKQEKS